MTLRGIVEPGHLHLSIARQREIIGLPRSTFYYAPVGESEENIELMKVIDALYTKYLFWAQGR